MQGKLLRLAKSTQIKAQFNKTRSVGAPCSIFMSQPAAATSLERDRPAEDPAASHTRPITPIAGLAAAPLPAPASRPGTVRTRLLLLSDTHARQPFLRHETHRAFRAPLPRADVLLHAGDLTICGRAAEYEQTLQLLEAADAPVKLVIAGNHDFTLDEEYYPDAVRRGRWALEGQGRRRRGGSPEDVREAAATVGRMRALWTGERARRAGIRFLDEGLHRIALPNGAAMTVYASPYTPEFCDWGFAYERTADRFNPIAAEPSSADPDAMEGLAGPAAAQAPPAHPVPAWPAVDVLLTHGPPRGVLDWTVGPHAEPVGCDALWAAARRARPRLHVFGHIHEGWGAERVDWAAGTARAVDGWVEGADGSRGPAGYDGQTGRGEERAGLRWGEETLFVNASIMTHAYSPLNAPWVVELDLPAQTAAVQGGDTVGGIDAAGPTSI